MNKYGGRLVKRTLAIATVVRGQAPEGPSSETWGGSHAAVRSGASPTIAQIPSNVKEGK